MKTEARNFRRWWTVVVFAVAMAWVEAAVVFYLRSLTHRIEPHQPDPLPVLGGLAAVEMIREFATLVMLFTVGWLAGRTWRTRFAYMAVAFGFWDIFYYVFLKVICGWPHSLLDWDVLFLLPLPWWGPVLAPVPVSLELILWGTLAVQFQPANPTVALRPRVWIWILSSLGAALALYVFMEDALAAAPQGLAAMRTAVPEKFNWPLFCLALALLAAPLIQAGLQRNWRRSTSFVPVESDPNNSCDFA